MAGRAPVLDLRRVHYFLALCESLSFGGTARRLGISQPALSKAIGRLEEELGGKLIRREGRLTHLTPLGTAMRDEFDALERAALQSRERARQIVRGTRSRLRIAITHTLGPRRVVDFLESWCRSRPGIELLLSSVLPDESSALLMEGAADCAFAIGGAREEPRTRRSLLYREALAVLHPVNHPFSRLERIAPELVATERLVGRLTRDRDPIGDAIDLPCRQTGPAAAPISRTVRSDREEWVKALVRGGQGIAIVSADSAAPDGLALTPLGGTDLSRAVYFEVAAGRTDDHVIRRFADRVHAHAWSSPSMNGSVAIDNRR